MPLDEAVPCPPLSNRAGRAGTMCWSVAHGGPEDVVVTLSGELDLVAAADVSSLLKDAVSTAKDVTVELEALTFIDSSGLGALLGAHSAAQDQERVLRLRRPQAAVARILHVTQLDEVFTIDP